MNMENLTVTVKKTEFVRTRDALISSYMNLSQSIDNAVKAYLNHSNVIINGEGGASLNATLLIEPFNRITQTAQQVAQQALHAQGNGSIDPQLLQNAEGEEGAKGGKKKRAKRAYKQRDPNAPKRPLTAYFRYLGEMRPLIMEEVKKAPGKFEEAGKPGDISKIATKRWNALTPEQQEPYKKAYQDALGDYGDKVKEYKRSLGQDVDDSKMIDPELDAEADEDADADAGGEKDSDDSDSDSDSDSDASGESDDDVPAKPAPAAKSAKAAQTPKSAMKKSTKQAQQAQAPTPAPEKASSPVKKRKAVAEPEPEESSKSSKKKSRKSTVTAAADPVPTPDTVPESSPPAEKGSKKSKKDKKKRKSSAGEA